MNNVADDLVKRLGRIAEHDWRFSMIANTSDEGVGP